MDKPCACGWGRATAGVKAGVALTAGGIWVALTAVDWLSAVALRVGGSEVRVGESDMIVGGSEEGVAGRPLTSEQAMPLSANTMNASVQPGMPFFLSIFPPDP